jgi:hypothetical protein
MINPKPKPTPEASAAASALVAIALAHRQARFRAEVLAASPGLTDESEIARQIKDLGRAEMARKYQLRGQRRTTQRKNLIQRPIPSDTKAK